MRTKVEAIANFIRDSHNIVFLVDPWNKTDIGKNQFHSERSFVPAKSCRKRIVGRTYNIYYSIGFKLYDRKNPTVFLKYRVPWKKKKKVERVKCESLIIKNNNYRRWVSRRGTFCARASFFRVSYFTRY